MTLPLTPEMLRACYEFLRSTPPFRRWSLPPGDEIGFHVTRNRTRIGGCRLARRICRRHGFDPKAF